MSDQLAGLTPEEWSRIKEILAGALELPEAERAAFLVEACAGSAARRRQVEALLSESDETWGLPSNEAGLHKRFSAEEIPARSRVGERLGPYEIVKEIGHGGMGMVYQARRADDSFQKTVAIKLIRPEIGGNLALRRFRSERQILAGLDHPNLSRLLDGGTTGDGEPYLVMEYVEGETLFDYCDRRKLSIEDRLRLFRTICEALQHAHEKLVIHRDLKPGNILVTAEGVPKLLDFGIAKLMLPETAAGSAEQTATVMRVMTPDYASPEQIRGERVTTASDIYSLGVVLYGLLSGRRPYRLTSSDPLAILRLIDATEPEKPSTAATRPEKEGDTAEIARLRGQDPLSLSRRLHGDLDAIVLKAMRREPRSRYDSVEQFSEDIRRHLDRQPVLARKGTLSYRAGRFVRRRRGVLTAIVTVLVLSTAAFWVSSAVHRIEPLPFQNFTITKLTDIGKVGLAAISPDSRSVLYTIDDGGMSSLWLRNVANGSDVRVVAPLAQRYSAISFSPDGNEIYFARTGGERAGQTDLFRSPLLGGEPRRIYQDVDTSLSFSPDGSQIVCSRSVGRDYKILTLSRDGSIQRVFSVGGGAGPGDRPFWLSGPDAVASLWVFANGEDGIVAFDLSTSRSRVVFSTPASLYEGLWMSRRRGFLVTHDDEDSSGDAQPIAFIAYPNGSLRPITRDTTHYGSLSVSADEKTIAAVSRLSRNLELYVLSTGERATSARVPRPTRKNVYQMSWGPGDQLVYTEMDKVYRTDPKGTERTVLWSTNTVAAFAAFPAFSPDGRYLVFASRGKKGIHLWRLDTAGGGPTQLTRGSMDGWPVVSSDGKWVFYKDQMSETLSRVPLEGGDARRVSDMPFELFFDLSADGRRLLCLSREDHRLTVLDAASGERLQSVLPDSRMAFWGWSFMAPRFTPDGSAVSYPIWENGADNLWVQPLDGTPGRQITDFKSEHIHDFSWSRDGKLLALLRGHNDSDVVLIRDKEGDPR